jgi:hypothetical protein
MRSEVNRDVTAGRIVRLRALKIARLSLPEWLWEISHPVSVLY